MVEKAKNDFVEPTEPRSSQRRAAYALIAVGVVFLLIQTGAIGDIGSFFGSVGEFFGNLGGQMGNFFGNLGGQMGRFFGALGSQMANLWPLLLIALGVIMLFRRSRRPE
jgi:Flp pilus assembly pilin Flp